jgi:hypothetical protein
VPVSVEGEAVADAGSSCRSTWSPAPRWPGNPARTSCSEKTLGTYAEVAASCVLDLQAALAATRARRTGRVERHEVVDMGAFTVGMKQPAGFEQLAIEQEAVQEKLAASRLFSQGVRSNPPCRPQVDPDPVQATDPV